MSRAGHFLKGANTSHILLVTMGDLLSGFTNIAAIRRRKTKKVYLGML